jgi:hypothetical protein
MKKKIISLCFSLLVLLSIPTFAQGPGEPYFPETANGAKNINHQNHSLRWQNPPGTIYNEVYIHYDSSKVANMDQSALFISGYPSVAYDSIRINQQLYFYTRYFWCVVEYDTSGFTQRDVRHFTTTWMNTDFYQPDDFSFGLGKWSINNNGGCGWQIGESSNYTLPAPSTGKVLRADKNLCGDNINATAHFLQVNIMKFMWFARLEFNSDWKAETQNDKARVEMTTNNGSTWSTIWQKNGVSDRNNHIILELFTNNGNPDTIYTVQVRFNTSQYGTDSWWAIDNVVISAQTYLLSHFHPYITNVNVNYSNQPKMIVKFQVGIPLDVRVERKTGLPLDATNYQVLASYYSTYNNTYIDSTINDSTIYTYRVGVKEGFPGNQWYTYSNEATGYVFPPIPVELLNFSSQVNGSEVTLYWSTATETNNSGFEILRFTQNDSEWEKIGFVPGYGTTTEVHHYSFIDESVSPGNYQYRLKQIDFDGSYEYSKIIEVTVASPTKFSLYQNYPNPFNPTTKIKYEIPLSPPLLKGESEAGGFVTLKVYDVLGKEIATLVNEQKSAGTYEVEFNVAQVSRTELSSGVYFYQLKAGSFVETKKMVLLR